MRSLQGDVSLPTVLDFFSQLIERHGDEIMRLKAALACAGYRNRVVVQVRSRSQDSTGPRQLTSNMCRGFTANGAIENTDRGPMWKLEKA